MTDRDDRHLFADFPRGKNGRRPTKSVSWTRAAWLSLAFTAIGAPLLFGGAPGWTVPIIAACAGITALISAFASHRASRVLAPSSVLAMFVGIALFTAIQALPLPCSLAAMLAPNAVVHARASAALFGHDVLCTISEDPGVTQEEVLKALAWLAVYASSAWTLQLIGRKSVAKMVAVGCGLLALVAMVHVTLNAELVYGLLRPAFGSAHYAPFVNPNHLGGLTAMGVPVAIGIARAETPQSGRSLWIALTLGLLAATAITLSRGAILAALVGIGLTVLLAYRVSLQAKASTRRWLEPLLLTVGFLVAVLVVLGAAGTEALQSEFANADASKLEIAARAMELAVVGPWLGVGRGAFGSVFVERAGVSTIRYEYAENFVGQWCVDWGIVVGPIVVLVIALGLGKAALQARRPERIGAIAGAVVYFVHNLVDFGIERLGSACLAIMLLAVAIEADSATKEKGSNDAASAPSGYFSGPRASLIFAVTLGLATLVGVVLIGPRVEARRVDVAQTALETALREGDRNAFRAVLLDAARVHPREPIFPLLAGAEATHHREQHGLNMLNRAILLAPDWAAPHVAAARYLRETGHFAQAVLEAREAVERDLDRGLPISCLLVRDRPEAQTLLDVAARGEDRVMTIERNFPCLDAELTSYEDEARRLIEVEPRLISPRIRLVERAIAMGRLDEAQVHAQRLLQVTTPEAFLARARLAIARNEMDEARTLAHSAERGLLWDALSVRAEIEAREGEWENARATVAEMRGIVGANAEMLGRTELFLASIELIGQHRGRALAAYEHAYRDFGRNEALPSIAQLAEGLGNPQRAAEARRLLCELGHAAYCDPEPTP